MSDFYVRCSNWTGGHTSNTAKMLASVNLAGIGWPCLRSQRQSAEDSRERCHDIVVTNRSKTAGLHEALAQELVP